MDVGWMGGGVERGAIACQDVVKNRFSIITITLFFLTDQKFDFFIASDSKKKSMTSR